MAIINLGSVVRKREGSIRREHSPAQLKPTSLDIGLLELTVSCPSLLHPRDGTVGKNKGTVTRISHTPPTSPPTPFGNQDKEKFFQKDLPCMYMTCFCWQFLALSQSSVEIPKLRKSLSSFLNEDPNVLT